MRSRTLLAGLACAAMLAGACNRREPLIDTPVSPSPSPPGSVAPPGVPPPGQPDIATVNLTHGAVAAGRSIQGVVNLLAAAPATGAQVALSSSDSAASVPSIVMVPAGETSGTFTVTTQPITDHRQLLITARTAGRSTIAALSILAPLPVYFDWFSDPGDYLGEGQWNRLMPGIGDFSASCSGNEVRVNFDSPDQDQFWTLVFKAPAGQALAATTYESVSQIASGQANATMMVSSRDRSCREVIGRFTVREIDLANDRVNKFRVSFEQQCLNVGPPAWFIGELRVADMPSSSSAACQR